LLPNSKNEKNFSNFICISVVLYLSAQQTTVSGTVKSEEGIQSLGLPLEIEIQGTSVTSDENGHFTISANPKDVLEFYVTDYSLYTVQVSNKKNYAIVLKKASEKNIEGVVITALVLQRKREVRIFYTRN
jgi:ribose 5-phosphate isomerase